MEKIIDREVRKLKDKGAKEMAVSVAEQFKTEGKIEGKKETAFNLLKMGMDVKFVMRATGLSEEEVRQLKEACTDRAA
ncbi:hypothetical protein QUF80_22615 [Desulfococcaceae bacterium HSG8]|nr:hypothetical protein [Desulfococcaceae bacterium HSG8]